MLRAFGKKGDWTSMAFADLYGAWKIEKKRALQKVQSPFFPNALISEGRLMPETGRLVKRWISGAGP